MIMLAIDLAEEKLSEGSQVAVELPGPPKLHQGTLVHKRNVFESAPAFWPASVRRGARSRASRMLEDPRHWSLSRALPWCLGVGGFVRFVGPDARSCLSMRAPRVLPFVLPSSACNHVLLGDFLAVKQEIP